MQINDDKNGIIVLGVQLPLLYYQCNIFLYSQLMLSKQHISMNQMYIL